MTRTFIVVEAEKIVMRALLLGLSVIVLGVTGASAQMSQDDVNRRTLHGLVTFYSAGMVCYYSKWSFTKADTDEILQRIKALSGTVPKETYASFWKQAQSVMAEGNAMATEARCTNVREQYAKGRPFLLGLKPIQP